MAYVPPNADEIRYLIQKYWQGHEDVTKRANADDEKLLSLKVQATVERLRSLMRAGLPPHEAEAQAMREVALAD